MSSDQSNASATGTDGDESTDRPSREIAYRLFAAEFDDASFSYSESDEERAPNYVVTPTGARLNRMFAVGVLTEVERVNDDVLRGRVVDPTGAFVSYAGQYQPDEMAFLDRASPPAFVALSGKARTFQPEDSDRVFTSVRPESLSRVDGDTRDRWTVSAAEATLDRIEVMAAALESGLSGDDLRDALEAAGVDASLAAGVPLALDHYGTTPAYLSRVRRLALDALEVVAGDRDSVRALDLAPDEVGDGDVDPASLAADLTLAGETSPPAADDSDAATAGTGVDAGTEGEADTGATSPSETDAQTSAASPADTDDGGSAIDDGSTTDDEPTTEDGPATDDGPTTEDGVDAEPAESTPTATANEPTATANDTAGSGGADSIDEAATSDASETIGTPDSGADGGDELGDFDAAEPDVGGAESEASAGTDVADATDTADAADDTDLAGDEMYELDEEERAEIESEYGTEFSTGSEVDPAGEADIDVPSVDELEAELDDESAESEAASDPGDGVDVDESDPTDEAGADTEDDSDAGDDSDAEDEHAEDVDVEAAAVDAMADLDDGDGASREEVVAQVVEEYGVDPGDVEDAIQSALMSGQCYEPSEDSLKAI
jgi:RPA family protein